MNQTTFSRPGWDAARVQRVIDHYENISDDDMIAEDEAAHAAGKDQLPLAAPKVPKTVAVKDAQNKKKRKQTRALPHSKRLKDKGAGSASK